MVVISEDGGINLKSMKQVIIIAILVMLGMTSVAQKSDATGGIKDVMTADTTLNKFMLEWVGRPYKFGGSTEKGIDCSQMTKRLYKDVYGKDLANIAAKQWEQTERIKKEDLQVGDLVFFRSSLSPSGWHCGLYIGNTMFFHASNRYEGVKVSSLEEPRYKVAIRGYGRLKTNN
jgi:cell wall-associated NlpC family hydrolase